MTLENYREVRKTFTPVLERSCVYGKYFRTHKFLLTSLRISVRSDSFSSGFGLAVVFSTINMVFEFLSWAGELEKVLSQAFVKFVNNYWKTYSNEKKNSQHSTFSVDAHPNTEIEYFWFLSFYVVGLSMNNLIGVPRIPRFVRVK